jgi:hypothetical protein
LTFPALIVAACACRAQDRAEKPPELPQQPELSPALAGVPKQAAFSPDFGLDRERSVSDPGASPLPQAGIEPARSSSGGSDPLSAEFVRVRHDYRKGSAFASLECSFRGAHEDMVETLGFRVRVGLRPNSFSRI